MRTIPLIACLAGVTIALAASGAHGYAKGNDLWVLTGGDLGDYAMSVTLDLVESPKPGAPAAAPAHVPAMHYDLLGSSSNFAIPYQLANGPWVRYYPEIGLLRLHGGTDPNDHWFVPSPATTADLQRAIDAALAAKAAGQLEQSAVAVDFRARSLDKVNYRASPLYSAQADLSEAGRFYSHDDGNAQITGLLSEDFVMRALVTTVSRPPAGSALDAPA